MIGRWRSRRPSDDAAPAESRTALAHAATLDPRWLTQYGARTGSTWVRDVFAHQVTDGELDAAALSGELRRGEGPLREPNLLLRYARMLASTREVDREPLDAVLDDLAGRVSRISTKLTRSNLVVLAELYARAGRTDDMLAALERRGVDDLPARLMRADAANPWLPGRSGFPSDERAWLDLISGWYADHDVAPLALDAEGPTPFDRLSATAAPAPASSGPLVSVLMSTFRPGPETLTAVRSIVQQTWGDWELLVLDDASGPAYDEVLERVAALDDRVRVVRAATNAGTYVRRNEGLAAARGELVTIQDSDDWAHPQRLEHQVRHAVAHPEQPGSWLSCLRASDRLELVTDRTGRVSTAPAEPTLMFRREPVVERIGFWDPIRRAADREFRLRLETAYDAPVPDISPSAPLQVYRVLSGSLSSPDFSGNWVHPARVAYRSAFSHWHRAIAAGTADPRLPHPLAERPFPAPARFVDGSVEQHEVDVLLLIDVRREPVAAALDEVDALLADGLSVGVAHVESLAETTEQGVFPERLEALVQAGRVARVLLEGDETTAGRVVVRSASVLQGQPERRLPVTTERVLLVVDPTVDRPGETFAHPDVMATATAMFGVAPEVVAPGAW